jgi:hypothetical protein
MQQSGAIPQGWNGIFVRIKVNPNNFEQPNNRHSTQPNNQHEQNDEETSAGKINDNQKRCMQLYVKARLGITLVKVVQKKNILLSSSKKKSSDEDKGSGANSGLTASRSKGSGLPGSGVVAQRVLNPV